MDWCARLTHHNSLSKLYSATSIDELWNNRWQLTRQLRPGLSTSGCWQSNGKGFLSHLRQLWSIRWWLVIFNGDSWSVVDIQTSGWYIYLSYTTTLKCYPLVVIDLCTFPYNLTLWRRNHRLKWMELYPNFIPRCEFCRWLRVEMRHKQWRSSVES